MLAADRQNELDPFDIIALVSLGLLLLLSILLPLTRSVLFLLFCRIVGGDRADF